MGALYAALGADAPLEGTWWAGDDPLTFDLERPDEWRWTLAVPARPDTPMLRSLGVGLDGVRAALDAPDPGVLAAVLEGERDRVQRELDARSRAWRPTSTTPARHRRTNW